MLRKLILIVLLLLPVVLQIAGPAARISILVSAEDDIIDGEDDDDELDASVETDEGIVTDETAPTGHGEAVTESDAEKVEEDEEADQPLKPSPDADTHILFVRPTSTDLPAGHAVKLLVGFSNKGSQDFIVDTMDAAFRYPQDYSFYIQNFTTFTYQQTVEPQREATFEYSFIPNEAFSSRAFGLTVNINYRDSEGNVFQDAVFNTTINVTEPDEGLDGETFFLYVFLIAVVVLLIVGAQQLLTSFGKRHLPLKSKTAAQPAIEMGTQNNRLHVDYDWLPKEVLQELNKPAGSRSPKTKTSPRQRNNKRRSGTVDD